MIQKIVKKGYKKAYLEKIDFIKILDRQNIESKDFEKGFVWVLNTSVLFIADYNFSLLEIE